MTLTIEDLAAITGTMQKTLGPAIAEVVQMKRDLAGLDEKLSGVNGKLTGLEEKTDVIAGIDQKVEGIVRRVEGIDREVAFIKFDIKEMKDDLRILAVINQLDEIRKDSRLRSLYVHEAKS